MMAEPRKVVHRGKCQKKKQLQAYLAIFSFELRSQKVVKTAKTVIYNTQF